MTNRQSVNPVRLEEIRRLSVESEADARRELATENRRRRVFGPLFYSTVVVAAITTVYVGALRVSELLEAPGKARAEMSPDSVVAASLAQFGDAKWETRAAAVKATGAALLRYGPGDEMSGLRGEALEALKVALADTDAPVRADAAEVFGHSPRFGKLARGELTTALEDGNPSVRLAAAQALLNFKDESSVAALRALSDLLTDPTPSSERTTVMNVMMSEGVAGSDAVARSLVTMLSSPDEYLRAEALNCIRALQYHPPQLVPALEALLKVGDGRKRCTAALAVAHLTSEGQVLAPSLISNLQAAVTDPTFAADLRADALLNLYRLSRESLGRCGRELARQLDHANDDVRLQAATLLHMIDPETLAIKDVPVTN